MADRRVPRDSLTVALPIVLFALLLIGALAVTLAALRERDDAAKNDEEVTELVRSDIDATIGELVAALSGGSAIADDGEPGLTVERWERFAADAVDASIMSSLALEIPVDASERAAFEQLIKGPITEPGPDGLTPAGDRATYLPVLSVVPLNDTTRSVIGFDIMAEPARREAASAAGEQGEAVISAPILTQPTGRPAFFIVKPVYRPGLPGGVVGYMSTAITGESLVEAAVPLLPASTQFSVLDGDVLIGSTAPAPDQGRAANVAVAGREWQLIVDDGRGPNYTLAWLIGLATLLLTGAIAVVLRARIHVQREQTRNATRHARSADLAQRLAEARTTAAVAEAVEAEVPPLLGADFAGVRTVDPVQGLLEPVINERLPSPVLGETLAIDSTTPPGRAVCERKWVLIGDATTEVGNYGRDRVDALLVNNLHALVCIPLENDEGAVVGLLSVTWDAPQAFDETTMALLRTVAELCEQTLERARLHDTEHQLVQQLQSAALGPTPVLRGLEMSVRYRSAVQTLTMGGDWYDAIELSDHSVALVVGDVAGHGIPAVAEMIELRSAIDALLRSNHPIDQVVTVADEILDSAGQTRIATALVAVFDAAAGSVEYISAGHPPAVLRGPDGVVEVLMDGRRSVLGVPPIAPFSSAKRPFPPGSTFVAYTDGLVERRHEDLLTNVDKLAAGLSSGVLQGEELADAILLAHAPDGAAEDDIALVVVTAT